MRTSHRGSDDKELCMLSSQGNKSRWYIKDTWRWTLGSVPSLPRTPCLISLFPLTCVLLRALIYTLACRWRIYWPWNTMQTCPCPSLTSRQFSRWLAALRCVFVALESRRAPIDILKGVYGRPLSSMHRRKFQGVVCL